MIWTIVCFLIALFVLKRYAFGPIQGMLDKRQESIRHSIKAAEDARDEAQKLLEEHKQLIGQARGRGRGDPRRGAQDARVDGAADERGDRGRAAAPARGDAQGDRGRDGARARSRSAPKLPTSRSRRPRASSARRSTPSVTASSSPRRSPGSTSRAWRSRHSRGRRAPHLRRGSLRRREGRRPARAGARGAERLRRHGGRVARELRSVLTQPAVRARARRRRSSPTSPATTEPLFTNFLRVVAEKGRAGEIEEIAKEFERLMAREERRLTVELTTARELSDSEADAILERDREGGRPQGRRDAEGRSRPRRRHRPEGGLAARRRERPRKIGTTETRTREEMRREP